MGLNGLVVLYGAKLGIIYLEVFDDFVLSILQGLHVPSHLLAGRLKQLFNIHKRYSVVVCAAEIGGA